MPATKKKFNARFPPARIKKIMQTDEEVGKVAAAVPVLVSKAVEIFMESLLTKASEQTAARRAKTMSVAHLRKCIVQEKQFDFLKDLVANVMQPDDDAAETDGNFQSTAPTSRRGRGGRSGGSTSSRHGTSVSQSRSSVSDKDDGNVSSEKFDESTVASEIASLPTLSQPVQMPFHSPPFGGLMMPGMATGASNNDDDDDYDS